ncbi:MAG TPA: isoprenylcysteine carboxylmethyltransferase family protein [Mucilaginibacter sp.]|jgi:protein-S-isoprenylcysteine O-methyltransferase Ste14|nr:isoprenylcysteine carboxylmethyltransferase family protein [Mucilaginibacter sp.]
MSSLDRKAFGGLMQLTVVLAVSLFIPAGTFNYWQAWVFLAVFFTAVLAITMYLKKEDPKLLERRIKAGSAAETQRSQKVIQFLAAIAFILIFILSALDHRFGWSVVPWYVAVAGDLLVALGLLAVFFVFRENSFASATIEVATEQRLIATGPYAIVRHPMYSGAFVMLLGVPLALGSWWGLLTVIPIMVVIIWRLIDEEKFLQINLPGYSDYLGKVKYRLLPFIW